jgi:hypothetical protein
MLSRLIAPLAVAALVAIGVLSGPADAEQRLSGPHIHKGLAIYLIHGPSAEGPVPLTLSEALAAGKVQVIETGEIELKIENRGDDRVFLQAGDLVKGGTQDRVLAVSVMLPPRSGIMRVAAFCVEKGRSSARGTEEPTLFKSALEAMPSHRTLAMLALAPTTEEIAAAGKIVQPMYIGDYVTRQDEVWATVARIQDDLSVRLGVKVRVRQSVTSLQLSLEHATVKHAIGPYMAAIEPAGLEDSDVVGYVAAVNGRLTGAHVYPSSALFRKVWTKQLAASVTETIADVADASADAPSLGAVRAFLAAAEQGKAQQRETAAGMHQETREGESVIYTAVSTPGGAWVHKSYLAR